MLKKICNYLSFIIGAIVDITKYEKTGSDLILITRLSWNKACFQLRVSEKASNNIKTNNWSVKMVSLSLLKDKSCNLLSLFEPRYLLARFFACKKSISCFCYLLFLLYENLLQPSESVLRIVRLARGIPAFINAALRQISSADLCGFLKVQSFIESHTANSMAARSPVSVCWSSPAYRV